MAKIEQRYVWFVRELQEYAKTNASAFPAYWGILNYLAQTFCSITRVQILGILQEK